jgi:hypothetical protein
MRKIMYVLPVLFLSLLSCQVSGPTSKEIQGTRQVIPTTITDEKANQTSKDIQGTWKVISTTITDEKGNKILQMDSATHNLTKVITETRVLFTIYNKKTNALEVTGQGKAFTSGDQYVEYIEQSTAKVLLRQPMAFTYKIEGDRLSYEGGAKDFHIVEVLQRIE